MHVKYMLIVVLLAGCANERPKARVDIAFIDAASPVATDATPAAFVALARDALRAATTLASKCTIVRSGPPEMERIVDYCGIWKKADVEALRAATRALRSSADVPDAGFGAIFVRRLYAFEAFASGLWHDDKGYWVREKGVLASYQELASVWNDWQPNDTVPVDVGVMEAKIDAGARLAWGRCSDGPCITLARGTP
jgi:hypothetical protein